jgi:Thiol-disulfide isomerase and thioredoxins
MPIRALAAALVLALGAGFGNPAAAAGLTPEGRAEIEALRTGDMVKLILHEAPKDPLEVEIMTPRGAPYTFDDFAGPVVLVNMWATWCPPCLHEMPSLDRLAAAMRGEGVDVVTVNVERGGRDKAGAWMEEQGLENLGVYVDERMRLGRATGVLGLPTTLILDAEGREIARLQGDAEWDSPEAQALLTRLAALLGAEG